MLALILAMALAALETGAFLVAALAAGFAAALTAGFAALAAVLTVGVAAAFCNHHASNKPFTVMAA